MPGQKTKKAESSLKSNVSFFYSELRMAAPQIVFSM